MARKIDLEAERLFENEKVSGVNPRSKQARFYWATNSGGERFMSNLAKKVSGKSVLEIGCSSGDQAIFLTKYVRKYVGIDISDEAIRKSASLNLKHAEFICTDGHLIPFPDESFDVVFASGVLHHLDLDTALPEISRVLRPSGMLAFDEPLGLNPLFSIYRALTPKARTADEKPFGRKEINELTKFFSLKEVEFFGFFSILSAFGKSEALRRVLTGFDSVLAKSSVKWLMWRFAGFAAKTSPHA